MKLHEVLKGMCVKSWEVRENSSGKKRVYVRFQPKKPTEEVVVKGFPRGTRRLPTGDAAIT